MYSIICVRKAQHARVKPSRQSQLVFTFGFFPAFMWHRTLRFWRIRHFQPNMCSYSSFWYSAMTIMAPSLYRISLALIWRCYSYIHQHMFRHTTSVSLATTSQLTCVNTSVEWSFVCLSEAQNHPCDDCLVYTNCPKSEHSAAKSWTDIHVQLKYDGTSSGSYRFWGRTNKPNKQINGSVFTNVLALVSWRRGWGRMARLDIYQIPGNLGQR